MVSEIASQDWDISLEIFSTFKVILSDFIEFKLFFEDGDIIKIFSPGAKQRLIVYKSAHINEDKTMSWDPHPNKIQNTKPIGIQTNIHQRLVLNANFQVTKDGTWLYNESPIKRFELVRLFSQYLQRDKVGKYWLITPEEICQVYVNKAPFLAIEHKLYNKGDNQIIQLCTNMGDWITICQKRPIRIVNPNEKTLCPYIQIANDGTEALITRPLYYELINLAEKKLIKNSIVYGIYSAGNFFILS